MITQYKHYFGLLSIVVLLLAIAFLSAGCSVLANPLARPPTAWTTYVPPTSQKLVALTVDARGVKWVGTDGDGALILNPDNSQWVPMSTTGSKEANTVIDFAIDQDNNIWVGTLVGVAVVSPSGQTTQRYTSGTELPPAALQDIAIDDAGNPWFATWGGGVSTLDRATNVWRRYTKTEGLLDNRVATVRIDAENNKWFGTALGVSLLTASGEWKSFGPAAGFGTAPVWAMVGDIQGRLWCATQGAGVVVLGPDGQPVARYTTQNGLPDNTVNDVLIDLAGNVWFATNNGVSMLTQDGSAIVTYTVENGLGSNIVTELSLDPAGNIWAATYNGGLSVYQAGQ